MESSKKLNKRGGLRKYTRVEINAFPDHRGEFEDDDDVFDGTYSIIHSQKSYQGEIHTIFFFFFFILGEK